MQSAASRVLILSAGILSVFGSAVLILLRVMPEPRSPLDYVVIGAVATFAAMLVLFVILITTWIKSADVFYKKRARESPDTRS